MGKIYPQNISSAKIISKIIILLLGFTSIACSSEKTNESLSNIQNEYKAESMKYSSGVSVNTDKGNQKYVRITIINPHTLFDSTYTPEDIMSKSALIFFNSMSNEEKKSFNYIQIIIENTQNSFSNEYPINTLTKINDVINETILKVSDDLIKQDYNHLINFFAEDIMKDSLINGLKEADSIYGKGNKYAFIGFSFINTARDNNNNKIPIAKFKILLERIKLTNNVDLYLNYESKTNKIVSLDF